MGWMQLIPSFPYYGKEGGDDGFEITGGNGAKGREDGLDDGVRFERLQIFFFFKNVGNTHSRVDRSIILFSPTGRKSRRR
jgi:hypothetical protein